MHRYALALSLLWAMLFAGCGGGGGHSPTMQAPDLQTAAVQPWLTVNDYLYQLQSLNLTNVGASKFDLVVMDFANDNGRQWGAGQLKTLKNSPGGSKIALAYMSIGEAENYRFYWQKGWKPGNPSWLGVTDPDWPGDYRVKYWDPGWQAIIFGSPGAYLDRIIAQGFDGVYLDLVDSYELYPGRPTARQEMIDFVKAMSAYAKSKRPNFKVVPQNASPLINDASYLAAIDGIGQEELSYGWNSVDEAVTPTTVRNGITANLDKMVAAHKLVLVVDYTRQAAKINAAYAYSASHHFVEYCAVRNLDRLIVNAGHAPD